MRTKKNLISAITLLTISVFNATYTWSQANSLTDAPLPRAQVNLPTLGLAGEEVFSNNDERILGNILWGEIRNDPNFIEDPFVSAYLHRLVVKLTQGLENPDVGVFKVFAVNDPQLNAFAMPGKLLGIHSGLILGINREGELAAVLAHEIGHISQRHFARKFADQRGNQWVNWAGVAAAILATRSKSSSSGAAFEGALAASQAVSASKALSFSRDMEREADAVGLQLMQTARYDGSDMVRMLRKLGASGSLNESANSYARTHPGTLERMSIAEGRLHRLTTPNAADDDTLDFLLAQARLRAVAARSGDERSNAESFFERQLESSSSTVKEAALYGLSVLYFSNLQNKVAQQTLRKLQSNHPWVLALKLKHQTDSVLSPAKISDVFMQQYPELALTLAQESLRTKDNAELIRSSSQLQRFLKVNPYHDLAWSILADVYTAQNKPAFTKYAQSQRMAARHAWPSSLTLLAQAIELIKINNDLETQALWVTYEQMIKQYMKDEKEFEQRRK